LVETPSNEEATAEAIKTIITMVKIRKWTTIECRRTKTENVKKKESIWGIFLDKYVVTFENKLFCLRNIKAIVLIYTAPLSPPYDWDIKPHICSLCSYVHHSLFSFVETKKDKILKLIRM
jgi:hypothetical protein